MREIKFRAWDKIVKKMVFDSNKIYSYHIDNIGGLIWMQYTGLKGINNKEIYEGDIIKWGDKIFVVKWSETSAYFEGRYIDGGYDLLCNCFRNNEIIGNIYENPELLNEAK